MYNCTVYINLGSSPYSRFEPGVGPIFMGYVGCSGTESSLLDCYYNQPFQYSYCGHSYDAGVNCEGALIIVIKLLIIN